MKADKKEQRRREQLAALFGMEQPTVQTGPTRKQRSEDTSREAEAVIRYIGHPGEFTKYGIQVCDNPKCKKRFMTNRGNVGSCSDACRAEILAELGLQWDWSKPPDQRWTVRSMEVVSAVKGTKMYDTTGELTREPLVISGAALDAVEQLTLKGNEVVEDAAVVNEVETIVGDSADEDFDSFLSSFD